MGAALLGENVVAEAKDIFLKGIYELNAGFYLDLVYYTLKIDGVMDRCFPAFNSFT